MKRRMIWIGVFLAAVVVLTIAVNALGQFARQRNEAENACFAYLEAHTKSDVERSLVRATIPRVVFPEPMDKRFRSTCTYRGAFIELEAKPFSDWKVLSAKGLD